METRIKSKVGLALMRFNEILENMDCMCEDGFDCSIHDDRKMAEEGLRQWRDLLKETLEGE